jgi:PEP-CTERM motif
MHKTTISALALACAAACGVSQAVTVTVAYTLDAAQIGTIAPGFFGAQDLPAFTSKAPISLAVGDTLDYTVDFQGAQTVTLSNPASFWALIYSNSGGSQNTTMTGVVSLLDSSGAVLFTSSTLSTTEAQVHVGQFAPAGFFAGLPTTVTFGGVRWVGTVDSYAPYGAGDPTITSRDYETPGLFFRGSSFVTSVPEPGTWALMLGGLLAVGSRAARSRK